KNYWPMILREFGALGLPEEMAYIAWAESRFDPEAGSSAGAVGLWQLGASTARNYKLKVDKKVDERLDPEEATKAAARYLAHILGGRCWDWAAPGIGCTASTSTNCRGRGGASTICARSIRARRTRRWRSGSSTPRRPGPARAARSRGCSGW